MSEKKEETDKKKQDTQKIILGVTMLILATILGYLWFSSKKAPITPTAETTTITEPAAPPKNLDTSGETETTATATPTPTPEPPLNPKAPEKTKIASKAVVRVGGIKADGTLTQGSGFLIKNKIGKMAVFAGSNVTQNAEILLVEKNKEIWVIHAWAENTDIPIAMIPAPEELTVQFALEPEENIEIKPDQKIFITGYPLTTAIAIQEANAWKVNPEGFTFGGDVSLGSIGGPISDQFGNIVGIFTGFTPEDPTAHMATKISALGAHKDWHRQEGKLPQEIIERALGSVSPGDALDQIQEIARALKREATATP